MPSGNDVTQRRDLKPTFSYDLFEHMLQRYNGLEHKIRTGLKEKNLQFKNQKKKDYQNPTTRWVFF